MFKLLGQRGTQLTGYPCVSTYHGFRYGPREVTHGAMDDYVYDHFGWFGFTTELWDLPTTAGIGLRDFIAWLRWHPEEDDLKLMRWNDEVMDGVAYVDWATVSAPATGATEKSSAGMANSINRMHRLRYLPNLCEQHSRFTLAHASSVPISACARCRLSPVVPSCGISL